MKSIGKNANILPFQGADSYDYMMDMDNYIETQSRILTSETMALETIRTLNLDCQIAEFSGSGDVRGDRLRHAGK